MKLEERIEAFSELGSILKDVIDGRETNFGENVLSLIENQHETNPWFTPENVRMSIRAIADKLTLENLCKWTNNYPDLNNNYIPFKVGVIMAGNIPFAGFHDFLTVLISGNNLIAKTSSKDAKLISAIADILCKVNSEFRKSIEFTDGLLSGFDTVIATGSDNSSRYFEYYFGKYPHIIRKNRNSVAIIEGNESDIDLRNLGADVFSYFGLGCRNVSKIYVPEGFDPDRMIKNWSSFSGIINHGRYANNYEYNMAIYMVNREKFLDTGFLLMKESTSLSSPIAVLYYQYYKSVENVQREIETQGNKIQCIVSKKDTPFGRTQLPELWDYADNTDTLDFLLKKNMSGIL